MTISRRSFIRSLSAVGAGLPLFRFAARPTPDDPEFGAVTYDVPLLTERPYLGRFAPPCEIPDEPTLTIGDRVYTRADLAPTTYQTRVFESITNPTGGDLVANLRVGGVWMRDLVSDFTSQDVLLTSYDGSRSTVYIGRLQHPATLLITDCDVLYPFGLHIHGYYDHLMPGRLRSITPIDHPVFSAVEIAGYRGGGQRRPHAIIHSPYERARVRVGTRVAIQGIVVPGVRGVRTAEVQIDGGDWVWAIPGSSYMDSYAWRQWYIRHVFTKRGTHTIRARARDHHFLQTADHMDTRPFGSTAIHTITVNVV